MWSRSYLSLYLSKICRGKLWEAHEKKMASKICAKYWVKIESFDHVHVIYPKKERSSKVNLCRSISPMNSYADRREIMICFTSKFSHYCKPFFLVLLNMYCYYLMQQCKSFKQYPTNWKTTIGRQSIELPAVAHSGSCTSATPPKMTEFKAMLHVTVHLKTTPYVMSSACMHLFPYIPPFSSDIITTQIEIRLVSSNALIIRRIYL
jgi:hypothetical protein